MSIKTLPIQDETPYKPPKSLTKNPLQKKTSDVIFWALWLFIGLVSSYDNYLIVLYQEQMPQQEENPVCRWIMETDNWNVSRCVGIKMLGTIFSLGVMVVLHQFWRRISWVVVISIASFQFLLLLYLTMDVRNLEKLLCW